MSFQIVLERCLRQILPGRLKMRLWRNESVCLRVREEGDENSLERAPALQQYVFDTWKMTFISLVQCTSGKIYSECGTSKCRRCKTYWADRNGLQSCSARRCRPGCYCPEGKDIKLNQFNLFLIQGRLSIKEPVSSQSDVRVGTNSKALFSSTAGHFISCSHENPRTRSSIWLGENRAQERIGSESVKNRESKKRLLVTRFVLEHKFIK